MILSSLCNLYERLAADPASGVVQPGYSLVPCSYAVVLDACGRMLSVVTLVEEKRRVMLCVPEQKGRCGKNPPPYFLCDNSKYVFGAEYDKKEKRLVQTPDRLVAALAFFTEVAGDDPDAGLGAVLAFLRDRAAGVPTGLAAEHPVFQGGAIVFRLEDDGYVQDRPAVRRAWERFCGEETDGGECGQCLVTGERDVRIARTHTMLKGVADANTTGCSLVSFNFPSAASYGKSQSYNAPVSEKAHFAYTTALNFLLQDARSRVRLGDSTVVFWAERDGGGTGSLLLSYCLAGVVPEVEGMRDVSTEKRLLDILGRVRAGMPVADPGFDPSVRTYILGLAPNVARASVRFWYENTLEEFVRLMGQHYEDMRVQVSGSRAESFVSVSAILRSITVRFSKKWWEEVPAAFETGLFRAMVSGGLYPRSVYTAVLMRIRAEAGDEYAVDSVRAGFLKAYLRRYYRVMGYAAKMEELTVSLNASSTDTAYSLGRLFAVMEALQQKANGTATIRSRYFASASANPKLVFPTLLGLAQHHVAKAEAGGYYDRLMERILSVIGEFPASLSLEDQGKFILGYYHEREFLYMKKEDKEKLEV